MVSLVEKYDIALTFIFGVENVDLIAEAKDEEEVIDVVMKLMNKNKEV